MAINYQDFKETLEINREDIQNNRSLVNELFVVDLMAQLGYNIRKNKDVKRLQNKPIDWLVNTQSIKLAVKIFAPGENEDGVMQDLNETVEYCEGTRIGVLIITNGETINIKRYNKYTSHYANVAVIKITEPLNSEESKLINAISRDTFDKEYIDEYIKISNVSTKKILDALREEKDSVLEILGKRFNVKPEDLGELYTEALESTKQESSGDDSGENSDIELRMATEQVAELQAKLETTKVSNRKATEEYTNEIARLNQSILELNTKINELEKEIAEKDKEIYKLSGIELKEAQALLDMAINDNVDNKETFYIAVINNKLIKYTSLSVFAGKILQEVYEIKGFEASNYIYDSDIFKLKTPAVHNDLIMSNKAYDIDVDGLSAEDVFDRLNKLCGKFEDIIFLADMTNKNTVKETVKTNAKEEVKPVEIKETHDEEVKEIEEIEEIEEVEEETPVSNNGVQVIIESNPVINSADSDENEDTDSEIFEGIDSLEGLEGLGDVSIEEYDSSDSSDEVHENEDEIFGSYGEDTEETFSLPSEEIEEPAQGEQQVGFIIPQIDEYGSDEEDNSDEDISDIDLSDIDLSSLDEAEEKPKEEVKVATDALLVQSLENIDSLIWTEEPVNFKSIKYIGNEFATFIIDDMYDSDEEKLSCDELLVKCVDAILALEVTNGNTNIISDIKQKDFTEVNNFIKLYTQEYAGYPRINGTRYTVVNIETVKQVSAVLVDICEALGVNTKNIFIYLVANTSSEQILKDFSYNEESVQLNTQDYFNSSEIDPRLLIIKGAIFNNILLCIPGLRLLKDLTLGITRIKTKYWQGACEQPQDYSLSICKMIEQLVRQHISVDFKRIGCLLNDSSHLIVSDRETDVAPEHVTYMIANHPIFCSVMEPWQALHAIIRTHTATNGNSGIALEIKYNHKALEYYSDFITTDPSLKLTCASIVSYFNSCMKK